MKLKKILKESLLVAAGLCVGANAWADVVETTVVNCNFEDSETLFSADSRITVSNETNDLKVSNVVKFTCANNSQNGYSLATYNFSSLIGEDATIVKVAFDFYIPNENAAYRRFFTVGEASKRKGFGKTSYATAGSFFAFGLARNSSANYFSINGASTTAAASATNVLSAWAHAEITVNHSTKKVSYAITSIDGSSTYYTGSDIAFTDNDAAYCNQIDFFDCQDNTVSYLDNLVITKYVDQSKVQTTYTVKYQDGNGNNLKDAENYNIYVGDTFTASATDMGIFYSSDNSKKYVYVSGNESKTASATASENVITLVFKEYSKIAYTVTAKNGEDVLTTLQSGEAYADGSTTVYWSKYIKIDNIWYETTGSYGKVITEAGNTDVAYTATNVYYFVEAENINKSRSAAANRTGTGFSGGESQRHYQNSTWWTDAIELGGTYILIFPYTMNSSSASSFTIQLRDAEGNLTATGLELNTNSSGTFKEEITIPAGSSVALVKGEYNSNILIDYLTLTPVPVTATIGSNGYTTFASTYALDLDNISGGTAYYVSSASNTSATLTEATGQVKAGEGLLLKGDANATVTIPVAASGEALSGNKLVGCTEATTLEKSASYYVLVNVSNGVQFQSLENNGATIPAGKAYLDASGVGSRLTISFGETTGVDATLVNKEKENNEVYDLQGRRVNASLFTLHSSLKKGVYIVNGKKTVVK